MGVFSTKGVFCLWVCPVLGCVFSLWVYLVPFVFYLAIKQNAKSTKVSFIQVMCGCVRSSGCGPVV